MMQRGDMVHMWDQRHEKPGKHGKFNKLWLKPYKIEYVSGSNSFYLSHLDGEKFPLPVNGKYFNMYSCDGI
jgi:hypothetical protein